MSNNILKFNLLKYVKIKKINTKKHTFNIEIKKIKNEVLQW